MPQRPDGLAPPAGSGTPAAAPLTTSLLRGVVRPAGTATSARADAARAPRHPPPAAGDAVKDLEQMIILLLGSGNGPVPSAEHLQKEMYMLTKVDPELDALFRFAPHCRGPYSATLHKASLEPFRHAGAYEVGRHGGASLTAAGRRACAEMVSGSAKMNALADAASLVRHVYDGIDADEFLFLICNAYSDANELSGVEDEHKDPETRRRLAGSLVRKGVVTTERYKELMGDGWAHHGPGRQHLLHVP